MVNNRDKSKKGTTLGGILGTEIFYNGRKSTLKWWEFVQLSIKEQVYVW